MDKKPFAEAMRKLADKYHSDNARCKREQRMYHDYIVRINRAIQSASSHGNYEITYDVKYSQKYGDVNFNTVIYNIAAYYHDFQVNVEIHMSSLTARLIISWARKENDNDGDTTQNEEDISDNNN